MIGWLGSDQLPKGISDRKSKSVIGTYHCSSTHPPPSVPPLGPHSTNLEAYPVNLSPRCPFRFWCSARGDSPPQQRKQRFTGGEDREGELRGGEVTSSRWVLGLRCKTVWLTSARLDLSPRRLIKMSEVVDSLEPPDVHSAVFYNDTTRLAYQVSATELTLLNIR